MASQSDDKQCKVLLFGLGAIGSFYAFMLSKSPSVQLSVVARSNFDSVKSTGLLIESEVYGSHTIRPHAVLKSPAEAQTTFDYVVCAAKAIGQSAVATALKPAVDEQTTLVIIQNGVGNEEPFHDVYPHNTIISCVTWVGASQPSPGVVKHTTSEGTQLGLYAGSKTTTDLDGNRLQTFTRFLSAGGTPFSVESDMQQIRWRKVVWNCAWNAITSLTLLDTQSWLKSEGGMQLTRDVMSEVISVARACHVNINDTLIDELIDKILAMPAIYSSMHADRVAGRQMELDMILGTPVRKAVELGLSVPVLNTLYTLLRALNTHLKNQTS